MVINESVPDWNWVLDPETSWPAGASIHKPARCVRVVTEDTLHHGAAHKCVPHSVPQAPEGLQPLQRAGLSMRFLLPFFL